MKNKTPRLEIEIQELALYGFAATERAAIADAVQVELTRLFGSQEISRALYRNGSHARVNGGTFSYTPRARGQIIGARVAQQTFEAMNGIGTRKKSQ